MENKKSYKTKTRELFKSIFLENKKKELSARDVIAMTDGKVGEATVYRLLATLSEEGIIQKRVTSAGSLYKYVEQSRPCSCGFHLHCVGCGNVMHLRCAEMNEAREHIIAEHGFLPINNTTVIDGYCDKCKNMGENR